MDMHLHTQTRWFDHTVPTRQATEIALGLFVSVPTGWRRLWHETLRSLVATRQPSREFALNFLSLETDDGALLLDMPYTDVVLEGVARRCAARSRFICVQCGRAGRWRQFGMYHGAVLCPRCAAPQLLHRAIDDAVQYPGLMAIGGHVDGVHLIPEVLRKSFCRSASDYALDQPPSMDKIEFRRWVEQLQRVKTKLPEYVEFAS